MQVEHLDDLALLTHHFKSIDLSGLFDEYLPDHHNWEGISGGTLVMGWLLYILSESDHRLSHVQSWAESKLKSLSVLLDSSDLRALDFCVPTPSMPHSFARQQNCSASGTPSTVAATSRSAK